MGQKAEKQHVEDEKHVPVLESSFQTEGQEQRSLYTEMAEEVRLGIKARHHR